MSPSARRRHGRCSSLLPTAFVRRGNGRAASLRGTWSWRAGERLVR